MWPSALILRVHASAVKWSVRRLRPASIYLGSSISVSRDVEALLSSVRCSSNLSLAHPNVQKYIQKLHQQERAIPNSNISHIVRNIIEKQNEVNELISMGRENAELKEIADADVAKAKKVLQELEGEFFSSVVIPETIDFCTDVVLEVTAGVGGQEAMLFTKELLEMYQNFALFRGWQCDILNWGETEIGGVRYGALSISGPQSYRALKFEGGVHRVQRVPKTEKAGRIHTSAASVAILVAPSEVDVQINPDDLKIETKRASGAGGQHVNKTESAVRITHLPTGTSVECQTERSQIKNKSNAMKRLRAILYQSEVDKQRSQIQSSRKLQVGKGDRNEKIRTYNYVQDRITDHRIGLTVYNLQEVMNGHDALDEVINQLQEYDKSERLEELFK